MKIIVDTNIVFSAILNSSSRIAFVLLYPNKNLEFYSCDFLKVEILKHRTKLLKLTKLEEAELDYLEMLITSKITFLNEVLIPKKETMLTHEFLKDIDIDDTPFVSLTKFLDGILWTGDKVLLEGLRAKNFVPTVTTFELFNLLQEM